MATIPFDPTLVLGSIIEKRKLFNLMELAEINNKQIVAKDKLDNLTRMNYSLKMIQSEMSSLEVTFDKLLPLIEKIDKLKDETVQAAIDYATTAIECEEETRQAKIKHGQNVISASAESPIDYGKSKVTPFPLSFDSLKFDVQYVRNEEQQDSSASHSSQLSVTAGMSMSSLIGKQASTSMSASTNSASHEQQSFNQVEGTIVITAFATHKNATVIEPFILDPLKAVGSWNYTFPDDPVKTDPMSIFEAALDNFDKPIANQSCLELLSGCTKASSFVGFVHILKTEATKSSQDSSSAALAMQATIENDLWISSKKGTFGTSMSTASLSKSLSSTSSIKNHANLCCEGCIPNIAASKIVPTIMQLNPDPAANMEALAAIQGSSDGAVNQSMQAQSGEAKGGSQYMELKSEHVKNTTESLSAIEREAAEVIDTNSMMTAFTDFCDKATDSDGGVPINFYIKRLTKADIAKCYIRKFYPNGASDPKAARRGMMGQGAKEEEQEEE